MEGDLDAIIAALQKADYEAKLAALTGRPLADFPRPAAGPGRDDAD